MATFDDHQPATMGGKTSCFTEIKDHSRCSGHRRLTGSPVHANPIRAEFSILEPLDPKDLVPKAKVFLSQLGVVKNSELGNTPCLILDWGALQGLA